MIPVAEFDPDISETISVYTYREYLDRIEDRAAEQGLRSLSAVATLLVSRFMRGQIPPFSKEAAAVRDPAKRKTSVRIPPESWYDGTGYLPEAAKSSRFRNQTVRELLTALASGEIDLHIEIR